MRISDWSSDVCSSDLHQARLSPRFRAHSPPFPRDCVAEHAGSPPASPEHAADHAHVSGPRRRTRQGRDRREARSRSSRSRSEERRGGKEGVSTCRFRGSPYHKKKKTKKKEMKR